MAQKKDPEQTQVELSSRNSLAWKIWVDLEGQVLIHHTKEEGKKEGKPFIVVMIEAVDILFDWYGVPTYPHKFRLRIWEKLRTLQAVRNNPDQYRAYEGVV